MKHTILVVFFTLLMTISFAEKTKIEFSADKMTGSVIKENTKTLLTGNAVVKTEDLEIKGETIKLSGKDFKYINASEKVTGESKKDEFSFQTDLLKHDREKKISEFFGNVKFLDKKNGAEISADYAYYDENAETLILRFNIVIIKKETTCKSFFATYRRKTSMLDLIGKPSVKKEGDVFNAERILINLDTEEITLEGKVSGNVIEEESSETEETPNANEPETEKQDEGNEPNAE